MIENNILLNLFSFEFEMDFLVDRFFLCIFIYSDWKTKKMVGNNTSFLSVFILIQFSMVFFFTLILKDLSDCWALLATAAWASRILTLHSISAFVVAPCTSLFGQTEQRIFCFVLVLSSIFSFLLRTIMPVRRIKSTKKDYVLFWVL